MVFFCKVISQTGVVLVLVDVFLNMCFQSCHVFFFKKWVCIVFLQSLFIFYWIGSVFSRCVHSGCHRVQNCFLKELFFEVVFFLIFLDLF